MSLFAQVQAGVWVEDERFIARHPWRVEVGEGFHTRWTSVRAAAQTASFYRTEARGPGEEVLTVQECDRIAASR